jgi:hypothetical protein
LTETGAAVRCVPRFSGRGGIGRHAGFRYLWRKPWGFESLRPHQSMPGSALFATVAGKAMKREIYAGYRNQ